MKVNHGVFIHHEQVKHELTYGDRVMLICTIDWPSFRSPFFRRILSRINRYYRRQATIFLRYCQAELYPSAVEQYRFTQKKGYPFNPFEAMLVHNVTYNENCALSLYADQYEYTDGAHGTTKRTSDTWNLAKGCRYTLKDFFPNVLDYKRSLINRINERIAWQIKGGQGAYFDNYEQLVHDTFNLENYYLTPQGIVIYFQQYDIAPYSSGIVEFLFPYGRDGIVAPEC